MGATVKVARQSPRAGSLDFHPHGDVARLARKPSQGLPVVAMTRA